MNEYIICLEKAIREIEQLESAIKQQLDYYKNGQLSEMYMCSLESCWGDLDEVLSRASELFSQIETFSIDKQKFDKLQKEYKELEEKSFHLEYKNERLTEKLEEFEAIKKNFKEEK